MKIVTQISMKSDKEKQNEIIFLSLIAPAHNIYVVNINS